MLGFVQNWFAPAASAIGVDFGTDCLRLAQVEPADGTEFKLVAAASADVPTSVRNDTPARFAFYAEAMRDLLGQGGFRGRRAILSLPASLMYIQHMRMPRMDDDAMKKALPWELRGKLPIDPSHALLRHLVAGEVYHDQDQKSEVIVMAARRDLVEQLLAAASKAKLDVVGMNVEPKAIIDCFSRVYRRKGDAEATTCYLDIGCNASRAVIARGTQVLFARIIPIGGEHFNRAVASALKLPLEEARLLRVRLAQGQTESARERCAAPVEPADAESVASAMAVAESDREIQNEFALLTAGLNAAQKQQRSAQADAPVAASAPAPSQAVSEGPSDAELACREPMMKLVEELALCRRYYEATFPTKPLDRLIFLGGEARHRTLCQSIARELGIAAQIGDPLARMGRTSEVGIESGIDRRLPQPAWTIAIGLSMGPMGAGTGAGAASASNARS
jgi:type IV pilus assembly protein PilM